jgi:hypothetical protein
MLGWLLNLGFGGTSVVLVAEAYSLAELAARFRTMLADLRFALEPAPARYKLSEIP